jgi:hypothetical protein
MQFFPRIKNIGRLKCSKKTSYLPNHVVVPETDSKDALALMGRT